MNTWDLFWELMCPYPVVLSLRRQSQEWMHKRKFKNYHFLNSTKLEVDTCDEYNNQTQM